MSGVPVVGSVVGGGKKRRATGRRSAGFIGRSAVRRAMSQANRLAAKKKVTKKKATKKKATKKKAAADATVESAASGGRPYSKSSTVLGGSLGSEESVRRATLLGG